MIVETSSPSLPLLSLQQLLTREQPIRNLIPTQVEKTAEGTPLIIDNGSHTLRVGWNIHSNPTLECEVEWFLCTHLRVPIRHTDRIPHAHSGPITYHWTHFELMMDECLDRFIGPDASYINHPILLTEPVCVPHYTRTRMTELWFEAYRVPSLCFGVDALYSLYHHHHHHTLSMNRQGELILGGGGGGGGESQYQQHLLPHNILVVSAAHSATHLLPIVNGEWLPHLSLRLDVAGAHCTEYFQRLLHLKYPLHRTSLSRDIVQHLKHLLCYTAPHYIEELTRYAVYFSNSPVATEQIPTSGPILLQLPLNSSSLSSSSSPSLSSSAKTTEDPSELMRREQVRQERAARMRELSQKKRIQMIEERVALWNRLLQLFEKKHTDPSTFETELQVQGLTSEYELRQALTDIYRYLRRRGVELQVPDTLASFLHVQKTKPSKTTVSGQTVHQTNHNSKNRNNNSKNDESGERSQEEWLSSVRDRFRALSSLLLPPRQPLSTSGRIVRDQRLKFVTTLEKSTSTTSHRRSSRRTTKDNEEEDDFGARDEDWDIYLQASRLMDGVDSEELSELRNLYSTLQAHDPNYLRHIAHEVDLTLLTSTMTSLPSSSPSSSLSNVRTSLYGTPSESIQQDLQQLYIGTERIRVSEVVWQPSLLGSTQMGLAEAINFLLRRLPSSIRQTSFFPLRVFLTGGHSLLRGFPLRLFNEVFSILPSVEGSDQLMFIDESNGLLYSAPSLRIERALDPLRDAWRGAQQWTRSFPDALHSASLHRRQYEEHGPERLHMITPRHFASNPPLPFVAL